MTPPQEVSRNRDLQIAIAVTKDEKRAAVAVAAALGMDHSLLLREMSLSEIVARYDRMKEAERKATAAATG